MEPFELPTLFRFPRRTITILISAFVGVTVVLWALGVPADWVIVIIFLLFGSLATWVGGSFLQHIFVLTEFLGNINNVAVGLVLTKLTDEERARINDVIRAGQKKLERWLNPL